MAPISISTPLPVNTPVEAVLRALHNHECYIKATCPELISYKLDEGDSASTAVYSVTDKKPVGQTTYKLSLTNVADGIDTLVTAKAPLGTMSIASKWRVANGLLTEQVEIDANFATKAMVKNTVEKNHPAQHKTLLAEALEV